MTVIEIQICSQKEASEESNNTLNIKRMIEDVQHTHITPSPAVLEYYFAHCSRGLAVFEYSIQNTGNDIFRPPQCTPLWS